MPPAAQGSLFLPPRAMRVWWLSFFLPTAYTLLLVFEDLLGLGWGDKPGTSARIFISLIFLFPLLGLVFCSFSVVLSRARARQKVGWMAFSFVGIALQFAALFVGLGIFY